MSLRTNRRLPHRAARGAAAAAALLAALPACAAGATRATVAPSLTAPASKATLVGEGFGAGRRVRISVGRRVLRARTDRSGTFRRTLAIERRTEVTSRAGRRRVRSVYVPGTAEVAAATGQRLRWRVAGRSLRLRGSGFQERQRIVARVAGRAHRLRADRRGRLVASIAVFAPGRGSLRAGRVRLPFAYTVATVTGQPSFPIRAAFYYQWFPEAWRQRGLEPFTHFTPSAGFYSQDDPATLRRQVGELLYANVDAGIASWHGKGTHDDERLPHLLDATAGTPLKWTIYYEREGNGDPDPAAIRADLAYIRDRFTTHPNYLKVGGRPVVFVWGDSGDGAATARRWREANDLGFYVVLKVFSGYRDVPDQPDGWHQYAPAKAEDSQSGRSFTISPGFWHAQEQQPRLERSADRFAQSVRDMIASNAPWQLVTTFNEWGEGTAVEPAEEWRTASGYGAYLDALHTNGR